MIGYEQPKKPAVAKTVPVASADLQGAKLFRWMLDRAQEFGLRYLLAHADDGVIWGRVDDENGLLNLITARDAASEYLRHAIPISIQSLKQDDLGNLQPPRLVVRHYLGKEIIARVVASRLVGFEDERGG